LRSNHRKTTRIIPLQRQSRQRFTIRSWSWIEWFGSIREGKELITMAQSGTRTSLFAKSSFPSGAVLRNTSTSQYRFPKCQLILPRQLWVYFIEIPKNSTQPPETGQSNTQQNHEEQSFAKSPKQTFLHRRFFWIEIRKLRERERREKREERRERGTTTTLDNIF